MTYTIAFVNQKGGSGKSKVCGGVAGELAALGRRILVVDNDPQGTITGWLLGTRGQAIAGTAEVLGYGRVPEEQRPTVDQLVIRSESFHVDALASDFHRLSAVESELASDVSRTIDFLAAIEKIQTPYDYILIDTPGNLGPLTMSAIMASDGLIIPIDSDTEAVTGFGRLLAALERARKLRADFTILGVVATRFKAQTGYSNSVLTVVKESTDYPIYATVRESIRVAELNNAGLPIGAYAKDEPAHLDFANLAKQLDDYVQRQLVAEEEHGVIVQ
jgi:chromosome partitioning protein